MPDFFEEIKAVQWLLAVFYIVLTFIEKFAIAYVLCNIW